MAGFSTDKDRKVIPRWRTFNLTVRLGELHSIESPLVHRQATFDFLAQRIMDWRKHGTAGHAADLVGAALMLGREGDAAEAARFLLHDDLNVSPWARELAEQALRTPDNTYEVPIPKVIETSTLREQVRTFRHLLRTEPRDPITWVELSRAYAVLGLREQAEQSMTVALQLANNDRFVLRSACRLWVHLDDPERAHDIIVRAERTHHDPWLLSAEIAIGSIAERTPRFVKSARRMLSRGTLSPAHLSELASAVATLELNSGSIKKSKGFFRQSLKSPTENSIAQAAWVSRQPNSAIRFDDQCLELNNSFEAASWNYYHESQWKLAVEQCKLWQFDQPFSSRPGVHGSYVSAVALGDYETSEWFARQGLRANQSDFTLMNNLAFALINRGNMKEARETLSIASRLQSSDLERIVLHATKGLLAFRTGDVAVGRKLYSDARAKARHLRNHQLLTLASVFHAIEEVSQQVSDSSSVLTEAFHALRRDPDPIFKALERKLTKMMPNHREKKT